MNTALSFTDKQLDVITNAARRLQPFDRPKFLALVAQHLSGQPSDTAVERACVVAATAIKRESREQAFRRQMDGGTG